MNQKNTNLDNFLDRVETLKKKSGVDLSTAEDLSIALMNLVSLEEHFFFTGAKTKDEHYFDTSLEIREMRKKLLRELMPDHEGETWCISKHLLSVTMRLIEVGNKLQQENYKERAKEKFSQAYKVYSIFWALKLKLINGAKIKETAKSSLDLSTTANTRFEDLVTKLADCCNE